MLLTCCRRRDHHALGIHAASGDRRTATNCVKQLMRHTRRLRWRFHAGASRLPVHQGREQIITARITAPGLSTTLVLRDALEASGVFGAMFCAPTTSLKTAVVRLTVHARRSRRNSTMSRQWRPVPLVKPWEWPAGATRPRGVVVRLCPGRVNRRERSSLLATRVLRQRWAALRHEPLEHRPGSAGVEQLRLQCQRRTWYSS